MAETVEELHLLLPVPAHRVVLRQVEHELVDARSELVGEVRGRGPDEGVDLGEGGLGHHRNPNRR